MKKTEKDYGIKSIIGIFLIAVLIPMASAQVDVSRDLPVSTLAGDTFTVTLTVDVSGTIPNAYGITETVPAGWTISNVVTESTALINNINNNVLTLIFMNPNVANQTITYQITVPGAEVPGDYGFDGDIDVSGSTTGVTGDTTVNIPVPPFPVAVTRDMPSLVAKESTFTVTLAVDVDDSNIPNGYGITETVPVGWTISNVVTESTTLLNNINNNVLTLVFMTPDVADQTITYQVTIPAGTAEGNYAFNGVTDVSADNENIGGDQSVDVVGDITPPTSTITSPADLSYLTACTTIEGTAVDDMSGVQKVDVSTDNQATWNPAVGTDSWSYDCSSLTDGVYVINSRATDNTNNAETPAQGITITIDSTNPTLTVTSPVDGSFTSSATAVVSGNADDANFMDLTVSVNGVVQFTTTTAGDFSTTVDLTSGTNTIVVTATDLAGNSASTTLSVVMDNVNPALTVTSPASGSVWVQKTAPNIDVAGTVSDANFESLTINVDGDVSTITTEGAFSQTKTLTLGTDHTITVTATDKAGNTATDTRTVKLCAKGDYDCNGKVDTVDFMYFAASFGVTPAASFADFDNDGDVDNADFFAFAEAWTG